MTIGTIDDGTCTFRNIGATSMEITLADTLDNGHMEIVGRGRVTVVAGSVTRLLVEVARPG